MGVEKERPMERNRGGFAKVGVAHMSYTVVRSGWHSKFGLFLRVLKSTVPRVVVRFLLYFVQACEQYGL